jgi:hypothetical protein
VLLACCFERFEDALPVRAVPLREGSWQLRGLVVLRHDGDCKWLPPGVPHHTFDRSSESDREQAMRELSGIPDLETALPTVMFGRLNPARALPRLRSIISTCRPDVVVSEASGQLAG